LAHSSQALQPLALSAHLWSQTLRLLMLPAALWRLKLRLGNLGHAIYDAGDDAAEFALHIRTCERGILNGIMEQCRHDAVRIERQLGKRVRHGKGMLDIGLA